jgi:hypothetical protein
MSELGGYEDDEDDDCWDDDECDCGYCARERRDEEDE